MPFTSPLTSIWCKICQSPSAAFAFPVRDSVKDPTTPPAFPAFAVTEALTATWFSLILLSAHSPTSPPALPPSTLPVKISLLSFPSTLQTVPFAILPTNPPLVPLPLTWTAHSSADPADPSAPAANKVPPASMSPTSMPAYWVPLTPPVGNTSVLYTSTVPSVLPASPPAHAPLTSVFTETPSRLPSFFS